MQQQREIYPRRSVLYMPGSNARALDKAKTLPADGLILDLEDAVAVSNQLIGQPGKEWRTNALQKQNV